MTETAAMAVAQRPGEFAAGDRSCGTVMPHGRVEIVDEASGDVLPYGETGLVRLAGENLFRGYWPASQEEPSLLTKDLGRFDAAGRLTILGRSDAAIITGGKKVHPAEVEAALRASGEFDDVAVIGLPDAEWGQVVAACHPPRAGKLNTAKIDGALEALTAYKRPKRFVAIAPWPRNAQGKLNRADLLALATGLRLWEAR
jgi:O-succinylbenzoic acid--CoA ligase